MHNLIKTFREYLAVHPQLQLDGHTMDEIALGLARLVSVCEISQTAVTGTFSADVPQGVPANLKPSKGCEAAGTSTSASAPKNVPLHVAVERAAFENFMRIDTSGFTLERHDDGSYKEFEVATFWHFWQARAALAAGSAVPVADADGLAWATGRWTAEVKSRPLMNVHRRSLDDAWRQVIRYFGGNPDQLLGSAHDDLLAAQAARAA